MIDSMHDALQHHYNVIAHDFQTNSALYSDAELMRLAKAIRKIREQFNLSAVLIGDK